MSPLEGDTEADSGIPSRDLVALPYRGRTLLCRSQEPFAYYATLVAGQYDFLSPGIGDTVVDAGANIGDFTILSSMQVGVAGRIIAIEPHPRSFQVLTLNVKRNALSNVDCVDVALGEHDAMAELTDEGTASRISASPGKGGTYRVRTSNIDRIVQRLGVNRVDILKMDIEGAEVDALRNQRFLKSVRAAAIEIHDLSRVSEVTEILSEAGLRARAYSALDLLVGLLRNVGRRPHDFIRAEVKTRLTISAGLKYVRQGTCPSPSLQRDNHATLFYAWRDDRMRAPTNVALAGAD